MLSNRRFLCAQIFVNSWFHFQEENSDDDDNDDPDDEASKSSVDSNEKTEKAEDESKSRSGSRSSTSAPGWFGKGRKPKKQRIWVLPKNKKKRLEVFWKLMGPIGWLSIWRYEKSPNEKSPTVGKS